jgi:hypothetical protein
MSEGGYNITDTLEENILFTAFTGSVCSGGRTGLLGRSYARFTIEVGLY